MDDEVISTEPPDQACSTAEDEVSRGGDRVRCYLLREKVAFGYNRVSSGHITISEDGLCARKKDPDVTYAYGVAFGAQRLKGLAEFEVTLADVGTAWSGTFKLGVMRVLQDTQLSTSLVPRYSPDAPNFCVWCNRKLHNRLSSSLTSSGIEIPYGRTSLDNLKVGDRLGLQLTRKGDLSFFVNGVYQGLAAKGVYMSGYDVYAVVDHYGSCKATQVTRSGECSYSMSQPCPAHSGLPLPPSQQLRVSHCGQSAWTPFWSWPGWTPSLCCPFPRASRHNCSTTTTACDRPLLKRQVVCDQFSVVP